MSRGYLFVEEMESTLSLGKEYFQHFIKVLRKKKDDIIFICDGKGKKAPATIVSIDYKRKQFLLRVHKEQVSFSPPSFPFVVLFCALPKLNRLRFFLEKTVELGVDEIHPLITQRSIHIPQRTENFISKAKLIIKEASSQSQRVYIPQIYAPIKFGEAIKDSRTSIRILFNCLQGEDFRFVIEKLKNCIPQKISVFIGPEGDFSPEEIEEARREGVILSVMKNMNILRVETCASFVVGLINFHLKRCV
ncbi:MAG: hypothetical protein B6D55_05810 [Candidatus Omnitrophica bacterium 4484_70.2]|nr:MAG: hypothetical protein B6D55_05810 [Candidatus Omnitrophica bacterium 4484_70.2]